MSSLTQPSWLYTTLNIKPNKLNSSHFLLQTHKIPSFKSTIFALDNSKNESSSNGSQSSANSPSDRMKNALEKARQYKKSLQMKSADDPPAKFEAMGSGVPLQANTLPEDKYGGKEAVRINVDKAREYEEKEGVLSDDRSKAVKDKSAEMVEVAVSDNEVPEATRFAIGKSLKYKDTNGEVDNGSSSMDDAKLTGIGGASISRNGSTEKSSSKKDDLKVSSIDFVGLNFADKKSGRGLPAGLVPVSDPFPEGDLPEVEILVGDASKFGNMAPPETKNNSGEESSDLYKPKVTTWGLFPRPSNISETYGGGRTLRPGEALETAEDRAAKEARTRQLIAAYERKTGLNIDPKLKAECEKALKDGDSLMDRGRLKEALPYYQKIMDNLAFKSELHGLAALQWSICQDSLCRPDNARGMYEKLQSHPNAQVSKKARQFMFSFQAMEMMKVTRPSASRRSSGYQRYFEAFVEDKPNYTPSDNTEVNEDTLAQTLPYIIFLASPLLVVLLVAASKGI